MKTFIKNTIMAIAILASFAGTSAFAASFDLDPAQSGTGFASINTCRTSCANIKNSISVDIPNPGDSQEFYIFLDFRNSSSGFISSPYGHLYLPQDGTSSSVSIDAALTGGYASTVHDGVAVNNLPSAWKMEFVPGSGSYVQIPTHTLTNGQTCEQYYGKNFSYTGRQFTNPETVAIPTDASNSLPGLDYQYATGWCQQGFVTYKVKVTNTANVQPPVSSVEVVTNDATNITTHEATLHGTLVDGTSVHTWFVYGTSGNPSCSQTYNQVSVPGTYSAGNTFQASLTNLSAGTTYYYRACAEDANGTSDEGNVLRFTTQQQVATTWHWVAGNWGPCSNGIERRTVRCVDDNGNEDLSQVNCDPLTKPATERPCNVNITTPEARTDEATNIKEDSAVLNGRVRMNDVDDGIVFFVYGTDSYYVARADDYSSYSQISTHGNRLKKFVVDNDNDTDDWKSYSEKVDNLLSGEKYYYRMCVEYFVEQSYHVTCGGVEDFRTDDGGVVDSVIIETLAPESVGKTVAKLCGDLVDDGGDDSLLTWIEYRKTTQSSYRATDKQDRGEGIFCEIVRNLTPGTRYAYRACSDGGCGSVRYFTTSSDVVVGEQPQVTTGVAYDITAHSAKLPATYISHANRAIVYFKYGRSRNLNKRTRTYTVYGDHGEVVHPFTNLKSDQRYCYQAVIETDYGKDEGAVRCFYTLKANGGGTRPVVIIKPDDKPDIDLEKLGLGLSLVQLDIDDNFEAVSEGQQITYTVRWKNISKIDLRDLDLNVEIPREVQILAASRGVVDRDRNAIFDRIDRLDAGEEGSMTVTGLVIDGNVGDALTASATIAFANPINRAQENAIDYDVDTFVLPIAGVNVGAGSVFGLGNVTFLGWITILLGLFIIFLIARWLYLEREDLRAQAYAHHVTRAGYYPPAAPVAPERYDVPVRHYEEPTRAHDIPSQRDVDARNNNDDPGYRPYRPRR